MRKAAFLTILLLILAGAGLGAAAVNVNGPRADVVLTEERFCGDPSAAGGLELQLNAHLSYNLFWNTTLSFDTEPKTETAYTFTADNTYEQYPETYSGLNLESDISVGSFRNYPDDGELTGIDAAFWELYKNAPDDGTEVSMKVKLADYYEYYPFSFSFDAPGCHLHLDTQRLGETADPEPGTGEYVWARLRDYFRIPVPEDETARLHLNKDGKGGLSYGYSQSGNYSFYTWSVLTGDACYFVFNNLNGDGAAVDTSLIPGGFGLYRLPYEADTYGNNNAAGKSGIRIDELAMVYPIDPNVKIAGLYTDPEKEHILLHTMEGDRYIVSVISLDTMECVQRLVLWDDAGLSGYVYGSGDDFFVMALDRAEGESFKESYFSVIARNGDGVYETCFTVPKGETELYGNRVMAFDGERLAIASIRAYESCGVELAVYDPGGLAYYAEFNSSLDTGYSEDYSYYCRCMGYNPVRLQWS